MGSREPEVRGDMNLVRLVEQFGGRDEECREYLEALRWPQGVRCIRCGSDKISRIKKRGQFDCDSCRYQFSVKVGTVFHDSHLPLWKWFLATYLICESKKGISANQLKRTLGVSYKTAWYLCHRIRSAMVESDIPLGGIVEIDETYVGGKADAGSKARGKGHGSKIGKVMVIGAIQRGGNVRLRMETRTAGGPVFREFIAEIVDGEAVAIYTDQHPGYQGVGDKNTRHESVDHSDNEWVRGDVGTQAIESAWSLLKRSIVGSYHQLSAKHLPAYLEEFTFRFNNRENPYLFRDTLLALCRADTLTYEALTAKR